MRPTFAAVLAALAGCGPTTPVPTGPTPPANATTTAVATASAAPTSSSAPPPPIDTTHVGLPLPDESVCEKNPNGTFKDPIPAGKYHGILRNAKCGQQRFLTMAYLCQELEIASLVPADANQCTYCHAPDPKDPKGALYAEPTEKKQIANWMLATFVDGLRRRDGKPMTCKGCHNDGKGHGRLKILKVPRDPAFAEEWMNEVMTASFVERRGKRLRCKTCHAGMAPGQPGWNTKVILQLEPLPNGCIRRFGFEPEP